MSCDSECEKNNSEIWRDTLKKRPIRSWSRVEIEEIVKEKGIDRSRFGEYSKNKYQQILNHFFFAFVNRDDVSKLHINGSWNRIRLDIVEETYEDIGWSAMLKSIKKKMHYDWSAKVFLLLDDGWLYEGFIDDIIDVLTEIDGFINAFYIFTNCYDKLAVYSDDTRGLSFYG